MGRSRRWDLGDVWSFFPVFRAIFWRAARYPNDDNDATHSTLYPAGGLYAAAGGVVVPHPHRTAQRGIGVSRLRSPSAPQGASGRGCGDGSRLRLLPADFVVLLCVAFGAVARSAVLGGDGRRCLWRPCGGRVVCAAKFQGSSFAITSAVCVRPCRCAARGVFIAGRHSVAFRRIVLIIKLL